MRQHTILVVDDEPTIREVVRRYLERDGFKVKEAADGTTALQFIRDEPPDLLVLDVMLPGMDGLAITRQLRDPERPAPLLAEGAIPIIILTAKTGEHDRIHGLELGADDYVTKPFSPQELVARVKAVLRRTHAGDPVAALDEYYVQGYNLVTSPEAQQAFDIHREPESVRDHPHRLVGQPQHHLVPRGVETGSHRLHRVDDDLPEVRRRRAQLELSPEKRKRIPDPIGDLSEFLDLAAGTGRRLSAICKLRWEDVLLERTAGAPHGAIRWRAEADIRAMRDPSRATSSRTRTPRWAIPPRPRRCRRRTVLRGR